MVERPTAKVIAFPRTASDPLQRALANLEAALADQRDAIAAWRGSISELQGAMQDLRTSLRDYDSTLASLSRKVGDLGEESRRLETWADGVLSHASPKTVATAVS